MQTEKLIPLHTFCTHHHIEFSLIDELQQFGLIEITTVAERAFIDTDQVTQLEQYIRLNRELNINLEGIDVIRHLLQKLRETKQEIIALKNRLRLYENPD
jgi:hypothetical protein